MKGIADAGFIVAFGNRNDQYHSWAVEIARGLSEPLLTREAFLAKVAFHLNSVPFVLALIEDGLLLLALDMSAHLPN